MSILPPSLVRGMKILNRDKFNLLVHVPTIQLKELKLSTVMGCIKKYLLKFDNFKPIQSVESKPEHATDTNQACAGIMSKDSSEAVRVAFLDPGVVKSWDDIDKMDRESLHTLGVTQDDFKLRELFLKYENWRADEIFKAVFPSDQENLTSFSNIGHIVHVNLKEHQLDYKNLIGDVLLDKVKTCKTVVNKTNNIDNTYRNFQMEVLSGEHNFLVKAKENKCTFEFDFSQVYWNPRLCTEHERIVSMLNKGDILFDVFSGVGPFAIPAAKKLCKVHANDLNPESYKWLVHNSKSNKVSEKYFTPYNMDGKKFICEVFSKFLIDNFTNGIDSDKHYPIHIVMNLPAMAVEFLSHFKGLLNNHVSELLTFPEITVHVYCFADSDNPTEVAKMLVEKNLGCELREHLVGISKVRNVSPKKEMMKVSFHLWKCLLFDTDFVPNNNKRKLNENEIDHEAKRNPNNSSK